MLTSLRIQNFRSIRDAAVKLGQVNLFIGPNNSGKSNFLKGVELASQLLNSSSNEENFPVAFYERHLTRALVIPNPDMIDGYAEEETIKFFFHNQIRAVDEESTIEVSLGNVSGFFEDIVIRRRVKMIVGRHEQSSTFLLGKTLLNAIVYKSDPAKFQAGATIENAIRLSADGSNIVPFLFYLSQNHKSKFRKLEDDLAKCVGNLVSISTPADPLEDGKLKLKFFDKYDNSYWAEEVSEGVLYFLALLCIVHQPDPPKLLLLEEPEKGIHPRRIREVMDFIFELARLRDIQIILTSHSPYVVDHFKDIPECISIFDRDPETGETLIQNADEYIKKTNAELVEGGFEPISYTDSLGEYWVSGFLGGVPSNNI